MSDAAWPGLGGLARSITSTSLKRVCTSTGITMKDSKVILTISYVVTFLGMPVLRVQLVLPERAPKAFFFSQALAALRMTKLNSPNTGALFGILPSP